MKNEVLSMALIAKWATNQDLSIEAPHSVRWEDGTRATHEDYLRHMLDTHTLVSECEDGMEVRMFPAIVADVRYDHFAQTWAVGGDGVVPSALDLADPDAPDDQIMAALYTLPMVYRSNICRDRAALGLKPKPIPSCLGPLSPKASSVKGPRPVTPPDVRG
jgi:hypothetical protein